MRLDGDNVIIATHNALLPDILQLYVDKLKEQARKRGGNERLSVAISQAESVLVQVLASQDETGAYLDV